MKSSYLSTLIAALLASSAVADVPAKIDYQGRLLDSNGDALAASASENFQVNFRVWDAQSGGNLVWAERQIVTVVDGNFSVQLGEGEPLTAGNISGDAGLKDTDAAVPHTAVALRSVFDGAERFVGVTVIPNGAGAIGEIVPRLEMLAAPFAVNAQNAVIAETAVTANRALLGPVTGAFSTDKVSVNGATPNNYANPFYVNGGATFGSAFTPVTGTHDQGSLNLLVNPTGASAPPINFFTQDGLRDFSVGINADSSVIGSDLVIYNKDNHAVAAFQQNGALAINTTSPLSELHVAPLPGETGADIRAAGTTAGALVLQSTGGSYAGYGGLTYNSANALISMHGNNTHFFSHNITNKHTGLYGERVQIDAPYGTTFGGNVTLTGNTYFGSYVRQHLNLYGTSYGIGVQSSTLYNRSAKNFGWYVGGQHDNDELDPGAGGSRVAYLNNFGQFFSTGGQYTGSDRRLKTDIESLDFGIEEVLNLKPSQYKYKIGGENAQLSYGFIAQEVQDVLPNLVFTQEDEDQTLGLNYDGFIPVLVNAIKELKEEKDAEIAEQALQIKSLEERLTALEALINQ